MKKWVSRVRIGVGVALVVLGAVLLVMGWMWPFYVSSLRTVVYGDRRPKELHGVRDDRRLSFSVLPWLCGVTWYVTRSRNDEQIAYLAEDQIRGETTSRFVDEITLAAFRSATTPNHASSLLNWRFGPFLVEHEHRVGMLGVHDERSIGFPPWLLSVIGVAVAWSPARKAWALRQRRRNGLCLSCGYEMKELAVCPECGKAVEA